MLNFDWTKRIGQIGLVGSSLLFAIPTHAVPGTAGASSTTNSTEELTKQIVVAAARGDLDEVRKLAHLGASAKRADLRGVTPWQAAKIHGRKDVADFLSLNGAATRLPSRPERVVDATLKSIVHEGCPGVAVLIARRGKILFQRGYGLANLEHHVPVTIDTKFRIGSVTKQFTAAAILKLQEQGKLTVDDKLSRFIPDFPRGDEVRVHHLLTHTSGIHSYTGKTGFLATAQTFVTPESLIQSFKDDPYDFDPGQKWAYNNSGYFLLGYIVAKVSGESYGEFLRKTFFQPLGMTNTGVHQATDVIDHEAHGYAFEGGRMKKALNWDMSRAGGAGSLYSTVGDMYRWNEAVFNGKVIGDARLKAAFTPVRLVGADQASVEEEGYGYGWSIGKLRGLKVIAHTGGLNGFASLLMRVPEEQLTLVVLANASPALPGLDPENLGTEFVQIYLANKLPWRPVLVANPTVSPATFDAFVGRYDYGGPVMTVTREGDQLFAQIGEEAKYPIFPKSENEFFWKIADAHVTFVRNEAGAVIRAEHRQRGRKIDAPRLPDNR